MKLDPENTVAEGSSTVIAPLTLEKDAATMIDMDTVLSDSTAPTSNHHHDHLDASGKNIVMEDRQESIKVGADSSAGAATETRDDPEDGDAYRGALIMSDDDEDDDDEIIEAEFETVLEPDSDPEIIEAEFETEFEPDPDPILMTRSPLVHSSDDEDDDDELEEKVEENVQPEHHHYFDNIMPEFCEEEMESGEIEVEYIEHLDGGDDAILGDDDDASSDVGDIVHESSDQQNVTSIFAKDRDSEIKSELPDVNGDEAPSGCDFVDEQEVSADNVPDEVTECAGETLTLKVESRQAQGLSGIPYDGEIAAETKPKDITPSLASDDDMMTEEIKSSGQHASEVSKEFGKTDVHAFTSDVEENSPHDIEGTSNNSNCVVDDSNSSAPLLQIEREHLYSFEENEEDKALSLVQIVAKDAKTNEQSSDFPEDEKESIPLAVTQTDDENFEHGNASLYPTSALPDETWSFDSTLKTKKPSKSRTDGCKDTDPKATTKDNDVTSNTVQQGEVAIEAVTWSFDSTLKMRKSDNNFTPSRDSSMFSKHSMEEKFDDDREDFESRERINSRIADDLHSMDVNVGESEDMDTDVSNSSDGETVETAQGMEHHVDSPSDDFDAILEKVAECMENRDWDSFVGAIKSRPSLAALSSADFSSLSCETSCFVAAGAENLLLHEVCKKDPTSEVVAVLISLHETAVKTPGQLGYLPLHLACAYGASSLVVDTLLKAYPDSVKCLGNDKMLPLHTSCKKGASEDVVKMLLTAHSAASTARDVNDHTPMYYALSLPEGREKEGILKALQLSVEHELKIRETSAGGDDLRKEHDDTKRNSLEMVNIEREEDNLPQLGHASKVTHMNISSDAAIQEEDRCKSTAIELEMKHDRAKLSCVDLELEGERAKLSSIALELEEERAKMTSLAEELKEERDKSASITVELQEERSNLASMTIVLQEERSKMSSMEQELKEEREKSYSSDRALKEECSKLMLAELHLNEERTKSAAIEMQLKQEESVSSSLQYQLDEERKKVTDLELQLEVERSKSSSLEEKLREEQDRVNSTERNLQISLSHLERTNSQLEKDQSTIYDRFEVLQNELAETKVRFLMEKQQLYQKSEKQLIEALNIVTATEEQLCLERTRRLVERQELLEKAGRQLGQAFFLVNDAEKALELKKIKEQEYEDLLQETQKIVDEERKRSKTLLLQVDRTSAMHMEKVNELEGELSAQKTLIDLQAKQIHELSMSKSTESQDNIADEESVIGEIQAKIEQKAQLLEKCKEANRALEKSNALKSELLESQQKKVEALELGRREKEKQLKLNQEATKSLEESITQKLALEKEEAAKVAKLKGTRAARKAALDMEEDQIKELDYKLARKQALIELEQMKEKTLEQTIAQKNELIESEMARIKELESIIAEKQLLLMSERNTVQALEATKAEKEAALQAEKTLIAEYRKAVQEKEDLLERKKKAEVLIQSRMEEIERLLSSEKKLVEELKVSQAERESQAATQKAAVEEAELRVARKESLVKREEYIAKCLERFASRKREIMATGASSYFVHATVNMKFLLKEAFLVSGYEKAHIREQAAHRNNSLVERSTGKIYESLVLKGPKELLSSFVRIFGAKSATPSGDNNRFSRHSIP